MADTIRRLAKRAEIIAKATRDYHGGRITLAEWRAALRQFRAL